MESDMSMRTFQNRLHMCGRLNHVRKAVAENVDENSRLNFASIKPPPAHLPVDEPDMKPYGEYAALLCLRIILDNKLMDTKAMLREESRYLERHGEAKAFPYLRGKESFLKSFSKVQAEEFYGFCRQTKPFSSFAASWCLEQIFEHFHQDADRFLAFITSHEKAYLQERGNTISMARWKESRERFHQAFCPASQAFKAFLANYWGVAGTAENGSYSHYRDGAAYLTFTTEGGVPDKAIIALAEKFPKLRFVHFWYDVECPENCDCVSYYFGHETAS